MKKIIALLTVLSFTTNAGLPPTTSKISGDATKKTTFNYEFPNFTGTHSGSTVTLDVLGIAGGGTGSTNLGTGVVKATAGVLATGAVSLITDVSNILPIANGGTGSSTQNFVDLSNNQTISGIKTFNSTIAGSVTGNAGTVTNGVYTTNKLSALSSTTSTELGGVISDETGTGNLVFSDNPTFTNLNIGTAAGNITGNAGTVTNGVYTSGAGTVYLAPNGSAASLTSFPTLNQNTTGNAATVTTNANLSGPIASTGNVSYITSQTGTGTKFVVDTSPTLVTPILGVATGTSLALGGSLDANTIFDTTTTTKASRPTPLMTTTQKNALTGVEGGMVFDSTLHLPYYYNGSSWQSTTGLPTYVPLIPGISSGSVSHFKFNYGATINTNCTSGTCAYLDQLGTEVTSVVRTGVGTYTLNFARTYTKLKCTGVVRCGATDMGAIDLQTSNMSCASCNVLTLTSSQTSTAAACNSFGIIDCIGTY